MQTWCSSWQVMPRIGSASWDLSQVAPSSATAEFVSWLCPHIFWYLAGSECWEWGHPNEMNKTKHKEGSAQRTQSRSNFLISWGRWSGRGILKGKELVICVEFDLNNSENNTQLTSIDGGNHASSQLQVAWIFAPENICTAEIYWQMFRRLQYFLLFFNLLFVLMSLMPFQLERIIAYCNPWFTCSSFEYWTHFWLQRIVCNKCIDDWLLVVDGYSLPSLTIIIATVSTTIDCSLFGTLRGMAYLGFS